VSDETVSGRLEEHRTRKVAVRNGRQHDAPEVVAVVDIDEPADLVVRSGGRRAVHLRLPLDLVLLGGDASAPRRLAAMDNALQVARASCPGLEVRVHERVSEVAAWLRSHDDSIEVLTVSAATAATLLARLGDRGELPGRDVVLVSGG